MSKKLRSTYLYADGHAVQLFEKDDKDAGKVEFAEVFEKWTEAYCSFKGRIIVGPYSGGLRHIMQQADLISAKAPSLDNGSQGTREKNIAVGSLEVRLGKHGSLYFHDMPSTISGPYTYQPDHVEVFDPEITRWSGTPVSKVHRVKQSVKLLQVAA